MESISADVIGSYGFGIECNALRDDNAEMPKVADLFKGPIEFLHYDDFTQLFHKNWHSHHSKGCKRKLLCESHQADVRLS